MNAPDRIQADLNIEAVFEFRPNWGRQQDQLWDLYAAIEANEAYETVKVMLDRLLPSHESDPDVARQAFSLSLLKDILECAGSIWVRDGRIFLAWPNWEGHLGRRAAQEAMKKSRDLRPLRRDEIDRVAPLFLDGVDGEMLSIIVKEGHFSLVRASDVHPSSIRYSEAFVAALRYWSMPYRGRTGRSRRFLLICKHRLIGTNPVVAGIIELGDEAPFCTWRDELLGLTADGFLSWLATVQDTNLVLEHAERTLRAYRRALLPTSCGIDFSKMAAIDIVSQENELEARSAGRSLASADDSNAILKDQKRITYALRFARGEYGLEQLMKGIPPHEAKRYVSQGIRALHDVILPRVHMEVTICGAVPPFSDALVGKLLVNFFVHPYLLGAPKESEGTLLSWCFDKGKLDKLLPKHGLMAATTKGLYAGHSAIYNRSTVPGRDGRPLKLQWLANTEGNTSTLISTATSDIAKTVSRLMANSKVGISQVYGSGGAKRHRLLRKTATDTELSGDIVNAAIYRPVYGTKLISNIFETIWLGHKPNWLVDVTRTADEFDLVAVRNWRDRWLARAVERVQDYLLCPSLVEFLIEDLTLRGDEVER
jgi:hypothetical protein